MRDFLFCLGVGVTFSIASLYSSCSRAAELPVESVCHLKAEFYADTQARYLADLEAAGVDTTGIPWADQTWDDVLEGCEFDEDFGAGVPLNELVAVDGEPVWPACRFEGGCVNGS